MSPAELGRSIRTHPKLAITAAAKMQRAQRADASYRAAGSRRFCSTTVTWEWLAGNRGPHRRSSSRRLARSDVCRPGITVSGLYQSERVIEFLAAYRFHENSRDLDSNLIRRYIQGRDERGRTDPFRHRDHGPRE